MAIGLRGPNQPGSSLTLALQTIGEDDDAADVPAAQGGLTIGEVIGEGGTARVFAARQLSLGREVALKELLPEMTARGARGLLLREARVTGLLEHPNIVPVHDVVYDGDGEPRIVLRRISGHTWSALLEDDALARQVAGDADLLEWHLRVLIQVCNAVHFAHSRGVVHRDLKPDNVMIGGFGEVYVVDWGLAVTVHEGAIPGVPSAASQAGRLAGTPAFMAPEMLGQGALSDRTDVFLLGALLYALLAGRPPYEGDVDSTMFTAIREGAPPAPRGSPLVGGGEPPGELQRACQRAMQRDPGDRFASAEALRLAIERYLRHRGAEVLVREGRVSLGKLREGLAAPAADRSDLYTLHAECAFAFEQALRIDPESADARRAARATAEAMAAFELGRGDPDAAAVLLAPLDPPSGALVAQVRAMQAAHVAARARDEQLRRDRDPNVGRRTRLGLLLLFGLTWAVLPLFGDPVERALFGGADYRLQLALDVFFCVTYGVAVAGLRGRLLATDTNRWLAGSVAIVLGCQLALDLGAWGMGLRPRDGHTLHLFLWFVGASFTAMVVERRLAVAALGYLLAWAASVMRPDQLYALITMSSLLLVAVCVWAWGRPSAPR